MGAFQLQSQFEPTGDQPRAITELVASLRAGHRAQTLLGVTGSGKTFTMANVIAQLERPTLVISHNKTLAAQLASEFREFFPTHAVHYFVSFYDYYQPESYLPRTDTYIEKTTALNEEINRSSCRHPGTTVSPWCGDCSFGIVYLWFRFASVYKSSALPFMLAGVPRRSLLVKLVDMQYQRNDLVFKRGSFRVKGEIVEIFPAEADTLGLRIRYFGDEIEKIEEFHVLNNTVHNSLKTVDIYPATHYVAPEENRHVILNQIETDMLAEITQLKKSEKPLEAYRLEQRTRHDLEMLRETGYVNGIENYSRYFDRRHGWTAYTLLDYFPKDFLMMVDESHMTIPQIGDV